jgi:Type III secretion protein YscO
MTDKRTQSNLKSLRTVRDHRVRLRQTAVLIAEQGLGAAMALKQQCERAVEHAIEQRTHYERDVYDQMINTEQPQSEIRRAMVHLKALGIQIESSQELVVEAEKNVAYCREQVAAARKEMAEAVRAEFKVGELIDRQRVIDQRDAERRQEEPT